MQSGEILAVVEDQFFEIRKLLDLQLRRTGEIQVELDRVHKALASLYDEASRKART